MTHRTTPRRIPRSRPPAMLAVGALLISPVMFFVDEGDRQTPAETRGPQIEKVRSFVAENTPAPVDLTQPPERTEPLQGDDAVDALGIGGIVSIADQSGQPPVAILDAVRNDPGAHVDPHGQLFFADPVEDGDAPDGHHDHDVSYLLDGDQLEAQNLTVTGGLELTTYSTDLDVFTLSSRPSATRKIYLDFTGDTYSGWGWTGVNNNQPVVVAPFSLDSDPTTFNATERQRIHSIWQHVAEDYAPFDIDVTTIDPGRAGLDRASASDQHYGIQAIITPTNWYRTVTGQNVCGVAYVGTFGGGEIFNPPVYAFTNCSTSSKRLGEVVSHETGHSFGLLHHGTTSSEYYRGHGDWAPIMGIGYDRYYSQWSHGEYNNARRPGQDDIGMIAGHTGFAGDDHGTTAETATIKTAGTNVAGLIGHRHDVDVFAVTLDQPGELTAAVAPTGQPSNLVAAAELYDSNGTLVASMTPDRAVGWTLTTSLDLDPDTYTIHVTGTHWLTPATGFSDYGSLGTYNVSTTFTPAPEPEPTPDPDPEPPPTTEPPTTEPPPTTTEPPAEPGDDPVGDQPQDDPPTTEPPTTEPPTTEPPAPPTTDPAPRPDSPYQYAPSTNDLNRDLGMPHVNLVSANATSVTIEFVNPAHWLAAFEVRVDGKSVGRRAHPVIEGDIRYPSITVTGVEQGAEPQRFTMTFAAGDRVEVRLALGAERGFDFWWEPFHVTAG